VSKNKIVGLNGIRFFEFINYFFESVLYSLCEFLDLMPPKKNLNEIVSGATPPPFRIFAGELPRRLRRRKRFGLIQEYCTSEEKNYTTLLEPFLKKIDDALRTPKLNARTGKKEGGWRGKEFLPALAFCRRRISYFTLRNVP
jgi:hypothetical protein